MTNYQEEEFIDFRSLLTLILKKWYYFAITLILSLTLAFLYIKTTHNIYKIKATVQLQDQSLSGKGANTEEFITGLDLLKGNSELEDEIGIITSFSIIKEAIERLDFLVSYYKYENRFGILSKYAAQELYNDQFRVQLSADSLQISGIPVHITFTADGYYNVKVEGEEVELYNLNTQEVVGVVNEIDIEQQLKISEPFDHPYLSFSLDLDRNLVLDESITYYFVINKLNQLARGYREKLQVSPISESSNIVSITTEGQVVAKEKDFLNTLAEVYIAHDLEKKNQFGIKTIAFIERQLANISDSLKTAETNLELFRTDNQIIDIGTTSATLLQRLEELEVEKARLSAQREYFIHTSDYLTSSNKLDDIVAPTSVGIDDPLLSSLILELSSLNREKVVLEYSASRDTPARKLLEKKIENTKATLIETMDNLISSANISINDIDKRIYATESKISQLPQSERNLIDIQRRFTLSDNIYNYLLQKRAEAGIAVASNIPDKSIIDEGMMVGDGPISPNVKFTLIFAILIGLTLPIGVIITENYFDNTIKEKEQLEKLTNIPLLSVITNAPKNSGLVVEEQPDSPFAETFKFTRVNLQYYYKKEEKVIGITSSVEGEGKTFCSSNLAATFAQAKKRTLLIYGDLRKPKVGSYFKLHGPGLADYILNKATIEEIIQPTHLTSLQVILPGRPVLDPIHILEDPKMESLIGDLKGIYDTIIIDTPPVGYVTDYFAFSRYIDINILVVRYNYTNKHFLRGTEEKIKKHRIKNLNLLFNDVKHQSSFKYGYYTSTNGYYKSTSPKKGVEKLKY